MNASYHLSDAGRRRLWRIELTRILVTLASGAVVGYLVRSNPTIRELVGDYWLVVPVLCAMVILRAVRSMTGLGSYAIELNDAWVGQTWGARRGVVLSHDRIDRIEEDDTGLYVIGTRAIAALHVPRDLAGYDELRDQLHRVHGIRVRPVRTFWQKYPLPFLLVCLIAFILFLIASSTALMLGGSAVVVAALGWWMVANREMFGRGISRGYQVVGLWLIFFALFHALFVLTRS
jgi:hypothetical protein